VLGLRVRDRELGRGRLYDIVCNRMGSERRAQAREWAELYTAIPWGMILRDSYGF
jgi:hypothetical protein